MSSPNHHSVTIFCSANDVDDRYIKPAEKLAKLIVQSNMNFIWGGSDTGLMKRTSDVAKDSGGWIIGISVEFLKEKAKSNADEMVITETLSQRREELLRKGDALVVMVGGIGTLDETTEVLEHKKHHHHNKPVVFLNTDNFYEGFRMQMGRMHSDGFLDRPIDEMVFFAETPEEAISYIQAHLDQ